MHVSCIPCTYRADDLPFDFAMCSQKGPKNAPVAVIDVQTGAAEVLLDKKNDVRQTLQFGDLEVGLSSLDDGMALTVCFDDGDIENDTCAWCGLAFPALMRCPVSKKPYCSKSCQTQDWTMLKSAQMLLQKVTLESTDN
jgi:hypothetical protein